MTPVKGARRWTEEEMLEHLRIALHDTPSTSRTDYDSNRGDGPSAPQIMATFGSWNVALIKAGLTPTQVGREKMVFDPTEYDFCDDIAQYIEANPDSPVTWRRYKQWASGRRPGPDWFRANSAMTFAEAKEQAITMRQEEDRGAD